ncbi:MAG: alpha-ketoacid dehydrogenase subunit beta [Deltaproteobacteria bacterium]|nr:MAG: alpha-ketoacid dehydrogenase subunit beta [Deltaproteobacteria bacterium]
MPELLFREALNQAMTEEMERDEKVFLIGEEVAEYDGAYKVSEGMLARFGEKRVIDTPIAELGFVNIGIGAAMGGLRPIVEVMTFNFAILALDAMVNTAAKARYMSGGQLTVPMVLRGAGGAGGALAAQHSQALESQYTHFPGLKVMMPATPADAKGMLKTAIRDPDPVVFIESEVLYRMKGEVPEGEHLIPMGKGEIKRSGKDVTVIAWSRQMWNLLHMVDDLCEETGLDIELVDPRTLRPLDEELLFDSVRRTHRVVIVEEGHRMNGFGAEISDRIQQHCFDQLDAPVTRVTNLDVPMPYSPPLEEKVLPNRQRIVEALRAVAYLD